MPWHHRGILHGVCATAVAGGLLMSPGAVEGQEVRVLVIRPAGARVVPADAVQVFQEAIRKAAPDVGFVTSVAEATDLIELTGYHDDWLVEGKQGVTARWWFSHRPLVGPPAARRHSGNFTLIAQGRTRAESLDKSAERLGETMRGVLERFRPVVFK